MALVLLPILALAVGTTSFTKLCSSLVDDASSLLLGYNTTLTSSTPIPVGSMIVLGAGANEVAFCQVVGSVAYGGNETLNFQLWLPDTSIYERRFMAVGTF